MKGRKEYLSYLNEFGLTESQVAPLLDRNKTKKLPLKNKLGLVILITWARVVLFWKKALGQKKGVPALELMFEALNPSNNTNFLLESLNNKFCAFLAAEGIENEGYYAGVFPTYSFNAHCTIKDEEKLILLNTGTFEMIEHVIDSFFSNLSKKHKVERICGAIVDYCDNKKYPDIQYEKGLVDKLELGLIPYVVSWAEYFVLAHEYGHIVNEHLDAGKTVSVFVLSTDKEAEFFEKDHRQEFQADLWASFMLLKMAESRREDDTWKMLACTGPIVFLGIAMLIERYFLSKGYMLDSHPPTEERIYMIQWLQDITMHHQEIGLGNSFLDLLKECYEFMFNEQPDIPFASRELNIKFCDALDDLNLGINIPDVLRSR